MSVITSTKQKLLIRVKNVSWIIMVMRIMKITLNVCTFRKCSAEAGVVPRESC